MPGPAKKPAKVRAILVDPDEDSRNCLLSSVPGVLQIPALRFEYTRDFTGAVPEKVRPIGLLAIRIPGDDECLSRNFLIDSVGVGAMKMIRETREGKYAARGLPPDVPVVLMYEASERDGRRPWENELESIPMPQFPRLLPVGDKMHAAIEALDRSYREGGSYAMAAYNYERDRVKVITAKLRDCPEPNPAIAIVKVPHRSHNVRDIANEIKEFLEVRHFIGGCMAALNPGPERSVTVVDPVGDHATVAQNPPGGPSTFGNQEL